MPGLDKILARLNEECEAQCDSIRAAADEKAAQIVARAQTEGNAVIRAHEEAAEKQAGALIARAESAGALAARRDALRVKTELIEAVLAEAKQRLKEAPAPLYFARLSELVNKHTRGEAGELLLGAADLSRLPADFASSLPANVRLSETPAAIEDGFILRFGDIEINCTFNALFAAAHDELTLQAAKLLFV